MITPPEKLYTITMSYALGTEASGSQGERILRNYNNGDDAWLTRMFCLSNWKQQERKQNMSSFSSSPERTGDVHRMHTKREEEIYVETVIQHLFPLPSFLLSANS
jgi:hypothetical protein